MRHVNSLNKKRILFFAPEFFGYENKIKIKLQEMGANVDYYNERSIKNPIEKAILKIHPYIFWIRSKNYFNKIIEKSKLNHYDYIFIIKCEMIPNYSLKKLKSTFPQAKFILYLYDSVKNIKGITKKFIYFDSIYSFDRDDCKKYSNIKFRPLFYADEFRKKGLEEESCSYDISFCGTIHSDRYSIIKKIQKLCYSRKLTCYFYNYLQSTFMYYFYKATKKDFRDSKKKNFQFEKLTSKNIAQIVENSRAILDIQHPKQTGLTIRTIEMIGMKKKIITTNKKIVEYDFYNPHNICVIDRKNIVIPISFLQEPYQLLQQKIYDNYSLEMWVKRIFS